MQKHPTQVTQGNGKIKRTVEILSSIGQNSYFQNCNDTVKAKNSDVIHKTLGGKEYEKRNGVQIYMHFLYKVSLQMAA